MAQHHITHTCGHQQTHQTYGTNNRGQRARRARKLADLPCADCTRDTRDQLNAAAADMAQAAGWPALTGTARQQAWGESVRADTIAALADELHASPHVPATVRDAVVDLYMRVALRQTEAVWWIVGFGSALPGSKPAQQISRLFTDADRAELSALRNAAANAEIA
jgi:hypothetical protein